VAAIAATSLSRRYGSVLALRDATISVDYGTVFALLGRNGSGKTTAVRLLTTLTLPTGGTATVAGFDVAAEPARVRRSIGVTMQAAALDPEMTGREHLELVCGAWGDRRSRARTHASELLAEFGLTGAANRLIATYSGGMKRRVDLAGALANNPRVLFLDEPTTGLDAQSRRALWDRVRALRDSGAAVFMTTQYLEEADALADVVAVLDGGRIIAQGSPSELREQHSTTTVRVRTHDPVATTARLHEAGFTTGATIERDGWTSVNVADARAALDVIDIARTAGTVTGVTINPPSLEDAYLWLTGDSVERAPDRLIENLS
jgi:ABC-type multidrug transport system ATPase subunit